MRLSAAIATVAIVTAMICAAGVADAQTTDRSRTRTLSLSEAAQTTPAAPPQRRGLRLNENGRWGLDFNLEQPVGRDAQWGDVEAGAYYRVNPRLRVGAAADLGRSDQDPARANEVDRRTQPRIRLESIFKF